MGVETDKEPVASPQCAHQVLGRGREGSDAGYWCQATGLGNHQALRMLCCDTKLAGQICPCPLLTV